MTGTQNPTVLCVDPSSFTAPYDAALTDGLVAAGCDVHWVTRPLRPGESDEFRSGRVDRWFYKWVDQAAWIPHRLRSAAKGITHFLCLSRLVYIVFRGMVQVVHFQWAVVPYLDAIAIRLIRLRVPVVLTVHDTTPFNGDRFSRFQSGGFDRVIDLADHVVVHTQSALETLISRGHPRERMSVIPHGPLQLKVEAIPECCSRNPLWTFVLFGQIKPYKGLSFLVEACAKLRPTERALFRVIVAGEPRMDMESIAARIAEAGLGDTFELRPRRLSEQEMANLFQEADTFVFPYSQIDASGVYFLIKGERKWIIATRVGIFAEDIVDGRSGRLVDWGDEEALGAALVDAASSRREPNTTAGNGDWSAIGQMTRALYLSLLRERAA